MSQSFSPHNIVFLLYKSWCLTETLLPGYRIWPKLKERWVNLEKQIAHQGNIVALIFGCQINIWMTLGYSHLMWAKSSHPSGFGTLVWINKEFGQLCAVYKVRFTVEERTFPFTLLMWIARSLEAVESARSAWQGSCGLRHFLCPAWVEVLGWGSA